MHALIEKIQPDKVSDGAQIANFFLRFFASCIFIEPHAAHFRPAF